MIDIGGAILENRVEPLAPVQYGRGSEAQQVQREIGDFEYLSSSAWKSIRFYFGSSIRLRELKGIVTAMQKYHRLKFRQDLPKLSRNGKRCFPLLVKYIAENIDFFQSVFPLVSLANANKQAIPFLDSDYSATVYTERSIEPEAATLPRPLVTAH
jgi:hypothetical protein